MALWLRPGVIFVWFILEVYVIIKKYLKTILYTFFTFIVGKTFEHLDMWVDLFFVSIWMLVDEKENINIENKKETIPWLNSDKELIYLSTVS